MEAIHARKSASLVAAPGKPEFVGLYRIAAHTEPVDTRQGETHQARRLPGGQFAVPRRRAGGGCLKDLNFYEFY